MARIPLFEDYFISEKTGFMLEDPQVSQTLAEARIFGGRPTRFFHVFDESVIYLFNVKLSHQTNISQYSSWIRIVL